MVWTTLVGGAWGLSSVADPARQQPSRVYHYALVGIIIIQVTFPKFFIVLNRKLYIFLRVFQAGEHHVCMRLGKQGLTHVPAENNGRAFLKGPRSLLQEGRILAGLCCTCQRNFCLFQTWQGRGLLASGCRGKARLLKFSFYWSWCMPVIASSALCILITCLFSLSLSLWVIGSSRVQLPIILIKR